MVGLRGLCQQHPDSGVEYGQRDVSLAHSQMVAAWVAAAQLSCLVGTREINP